MKIFLFIFALAFTTMDFGQVFNITHARLIANYEVVNGDTIDRELPSEDCFTSVSVAAGDSVFQITHHCEGASFTSPVYDLPLEYNKVARVWAMTLYDPKENAYLRLFISPTKNQFGLIEEYPEVGFISVQVFEWE